MDFNDILQDIVNYSYEKKVAGAKLEFIACMSALAEQDDDVEFTIAYIIAFLSTAIASDGKFTSKERALIEELIGEKGDFAQLLTKVDQDLYDAVDARFDAMSAEDQAHFTMLAIFILAVDDVINPDEYEYLKNLMM